MLILLIALSLLLALTFLTMAFSFVAGLFVVLMAITPAALILLKASYRHSPA